MRRKKKRKLTVEPRPVVLFAVLCAAFAGLLLRVAYLSGYAPGAAVSAGQRTLVLDTSRGTVYDRNFAPLVNAQTSSLEVAFVPDDEGGARLETRAVPNGKGNVRLVRRYSSDQLCPHVIGYLDGDGIGVCGIERAFDRWLSSAAGELRVTYTAAADGSALPGQGFEIVSSGYNTPAGVVLTVDAKAQRIVQTALSRSSVETGAAVILDVDSFEIVAFASVPAFDPNNVAAALKSPDGPFLNRALEAYPVGSVFKPVVAASALERKVNVDEPFDCTGAIAVGGLSFRCYRSTAHGEVGLNAAISRSCNGYFIRLASGLGGEALLNTAALLGFGEETELTDGIRSAAGDLPSADDLQNPAALANFAFGQGKLLASPLQLACAYAVIANGGVYTAPSLLKYLVDDKKDIFAQYRSEVSYPALSPETCARLREALRINMTEGTGKNGASAFISSAGKTATAQTGRYDGNGVERLCTWFCGFVPADAPKYAVVVFNENGSAASEDCAPVFKEIIEGLYDAEMFEQDLQPE